MNWAWWLRFPLGLVAGAACGRTGILPPSDDDAVHLDGGRGGDGAGGTLVRGGTSATSGGRGGTPTNGGGGTAPASGSGGTSGAPDGAGGEAGAPDETCVVHVSSLGNDANDGSSWARAVASLARALAVARPGCEVWLAGSDTYTPAPGADRNATFHLQRGMALRGGFAGTERHASERLFGFPLPSLSGDVGQLGDATDNAYHVVSADDDVTLDYVAVSGGRADASANDAGGAIHAAGALTLANCVISDSYSKGNGGGVRAHGALDITGSTLTRNTAQNFGGALFSDGPGPLYVDDTLFEDDQAWDAGAIYVAESAAPVNVTLTNGSLLYNDAGDAGGAIVTEASVSLAIAHSLFEANQAGHGAAILSHGPLSVVYSNFTQNNATESDGGTVFGETATSVTHTDFDLNDGGALVGWSQSGDCSLAVDGASFTSNQSATGGGITAYACAVQVTGSSFAGNTASFFGGAVFCDASSSLNVASSLFQANFAGAYGGAIHAGGAPVHLVNTLIVKNTAAQEAAAVYAGAALSLTNVTVADNASPALASIDVSGAILVENSVFWNATPSEFTLGSATLTSEDAGTQNLFASNVSGTSPNLTAFDPDFADPANGDYRLRSSSPCIDHADDKRAPPADLLGNARVNEHATTPCPTCTSIADMGAYEYGN